LIVSLIVARDRKGGIGKDNALPWRLSSDLRRFRELTMGHHIVMGRKTFESIGKPLAGRTIIIVTHQPHYDAAGCLVAHSIDDALRLAEQRGETNLFVGGGAEVYSATLNRCDKLYLTEVDADVDADTFFQAIDEARWVEEQSERHEPDERNQYPFTFRTLVRRRLTNND
jgi:dihydrofolate reductase